MGKSASTKSSQDKGAKRAVRRSSERAHQPALSSPEANTLALQRAVGNQATGQLLSLAADSARFGGVTLQRKCLSCATSGGQCARCRGEGETLQRKAEGGIAPPSLNGQVSEAVRSVLDKGGSQPLDPSTRSLMEFGFGKDFSQVRIHTDAQAAESAQSIAARAFTVGRDIVFGAGQYAPQSRGGRWLLAHELTHVRQQRANGHAMQTSLGVNRSGDEYEREADRVADQVVSRGERFNSAARLSRRTIQARSVDEETGASGKIPGHPSSGSPGLQRQPLLTTAEPIIQRVSFGESVARFFGGGTFSEEELLAYLSVLDNTRAIEDNIDSDNKARAIVNAWKRGGSPYDLTPQRKILLIKEMQSGFTGDDDEQAILELLERSDNAALSVIFGSGGLDVHDLNSDFHFAEWDRLQDFYRRRFEGGMSEALAGNIRPIGEPVALGAELFSREQQPVTPPQQEEPACAVIEPEDCPTYERWLRNFTALPTYTSSTGHQVIGPAEAPPQTATDPTAQPGQRRPPVLHRRQQYLPTDRFIDGPTQEWVQNNLPPNLVETAYQLPSDCADIAVILRHVWLAAHHRVELYHGWVCGSRTGQARSSDIERLIVDEVYTGNVQGIVNPYTDEQGNRLLSFDELQRVLHPGDILVWKHPGVGGHTHTVIEVRRQENLVTEITALQGNQPIGRSRAEQLRAQDLQAQAQLPRAARRPTPSVGQLRAAPGRRIEESSVPIPRGNTRGRWEWPDGTWLVAAGPPAAAPRPQPQRRRGQPTIRRLTDWVTPLQRVDIDHLESTFESALLEARATVESRREVSDDDARLVGQAAGESLRRLTSESGDLGEVSQLQRLRRLRAQIRALREDSNVPATTAVFNLIDESLAAAARGVSSIDFTRAQVSPSNRIVDFLVTGFDPFNVSDSRQPARPNDWNPSGAAALALDQQTIDVESNLKAAVEGVVLPVDFEEFRSGIVESIVSQHPEAEAIITVSLDTGISPTGPVDIEQFAVGVHRLSNDISEAVPGAPGSPGNGPAIIESTAPVSEIAAETARPAGGGQAAVQEPTVDTKIRFEFANDRIANVALTALGLPPQPASGGLVTIEDVNALHQIINTMRRAPDPRSPGIVFTAGGLSFAANIVGGPGGSYLSNEVSYRVLRQLAASGRQQTPSFHVHTPHGIDTPTGEIPRGETAPEAQSVISQARSAVTTLVATLTQIIKSVARRIVRAVSNPAGGE